MGNILANVLGKLDGVRASTGGAYQAKCPAHADKTPSLTVKEGHSGILLKCWAGCTFDEICEALDLSGDDVFYEPREYERPIQPETSGHANLRPHFWDWRSQAAQIDDYLNFAQESLYKRLSSYECLDIDKSSDEEFYVVMDEIGGIYRSLAKVEELEDQMFYVQRHLREQEGVDLWTLQK